MTCLCIRVWFKPWQFDFNLIFSLSFNLTWQVSATHCKKATVLPYSVFYTLPALFRPATSSPLLAAHLIFLHFHFSSSVQILDFLHPYLHPIPIPFINLGRGPAIEFQLNPAVLCASWEVLHSTLMWLQSKHHHLGWAMLRRVKKSYSQILPWLAAHRTTWRCLDQAYQWSPSV